jgi:hypothetical protein
MPTINIPESDSISYKDFVAGNPVQVRSVAAEDEKEFKKGSQVKITHMNNENDAKIVSEPIVIEDKGGKKTLALVIEKV